MKKQLETVNEQTSVYVRGKKFKVEQEDEDYELDLSDQGITSIIEIEGLDQLTDLNYLCLSDNKITQIEGLDKLVCLTQLDLTNNNITKIKGLNELPSLEILTLSSNKITRIEGLDKNPVLYSIELNHNLIPKIEGVDKIPTLQTIYLKDNRISKIEGLNNLPNLTGLDLGKNQIAKIEGLDKLPKLMFLELDHNQIPKIEGLDSLARLRSLTLKHNQIQNLEGLAQLTALGKLDLSENLIKWPPGLSASSPVADIVAHCIADVRHIDTLEIKTYVNFLTNLFAKDKMKFDESNPFIIALNANTENEEFKLLETLGGVILPAIVTELVMNDSKSLSNHEIQQISALLTDNKTKVEYCTALQIPTVSLKDHYDRVFGAFLGAIQVNNKYERTKWWFKTTLFEQRIGPAIAHIKQAKSITGIK